MNHLTMKQIQEFVDGSADYMMQATCTNHLATCSRCRREVALQKAILSSAKQSGSIMPSRSFTRRVMGRISPSRLHRLSQWLLDNMGAMFGMMAILGVTGSVFFGSKSSGITDFTMPAMDMSIGRGMISQYWQYLTTFIGDGLDLLALPSVSNTENLIIMGASIGVLVLLDRVLKGRMRALARH